MKKIILSLLLLSLIACRGSVSKEMAVTDAVAEMKEPPAEHLNFAPPQLKKDEANSVNDEGVTSISEADHSIPGSSVPKKIIRNGTLKIEVKDLSATRTKLEKLFAAYKAYISSETSENSAGTSQKNLNFTIRVDYHNFDTLMERIIAEASFVNTKSINAEDVTAQYVDVESRIKSKKLVLEKYQALLARAQSVGEVLKVESELRVLQEEIEAREGQLKLMSNQVQYSTIALEMYQNIPYVSTPSGSYSFGEKLKESLIDGWRGIQEFFLVIFKLWAFILIIGVLLFWLIRRRRRRNRS